MEAQLTQLLVGCADPNPEIRNNAEATLRHAEENSFAEYITLLAAEFQNENSLEYVRQLAGLMLKNAIAGKGKTGGSKVDRWRELHADVTGRIKSQMLQTLRTPLAVVQRTAAQVASKIGRFELPCDIWPEFFPAILALSTSENTSFKIAAQTCIGYLCEDLYDDETEEELSPAQCDCVLTTAVQGMRDSNTKVQIASTKTLFFALLFASENFKKKHERDIILEVVCNNCSSASTELETASFEVLVQIASEYYSTLQQYMNVMGQLTWQAIQNSKECVAVPALEFWSTIAEEEIHLMENPSPNNINHNFIVQAKPFLLPILLKSLTIQDGDETDSWTLAMAASSCLSSCAQVLKDDIVEIVLQFVSENFANADWKHREAAVMAYGSIMEGPSSATLLPVVQESLPNLCAVLKDETRLVRDTAAWTLGRISAFHCSVLMPLLKPPENNNFNNNNFNSNNNNNNLDISNCDNLLHLLIHALNDHPGVAINICWIINEIADNINYQNNQNNQKYQNIQNNQNYQNRNAVLDPWFFLLCNALIIVIMRPDAETNQLREGACNALSAVINCASKENPQNMADLFIHFIHHLTESITKEGISEESLKIQTSYCICLQALLNWKPAVSDSTWTARIFELWVILEKLAMNSPEGAQVEEVLLAIICLVNAEKVNVQNIMIPLQRVILKFLDHPEYVETCKLAVELAGDTARALESRMGEIAHEILDRFYKILQDVSAERTLKPRIMIAIGDIAMSIGGPWVEFLNPFMDILQKAGAIKPEEGPEEVEEWIIYIGDLRDGVLQAYSGIVYAMKESNKLDVLKPHVNRILELIQAVVKTNEKFLNAQNLSHSIALTGDLVNAYGGELMQHLNDVPFIQFMLQKADFLMNNDPEAYEETGNKAIWLNKVISRYKNEKEA